MFSRNTYWLLLAAAQLAFGQDGSPSQESENITWTFDIRVLIVLASVTAALAIYRTVIFSVRYVRTLTCLNNDSQRYFVMPSSAYALIKEHIIYAPMFRKRRNQELRLSTAMNMGVLPTRFQSMFLAGVVGMNVAFSVVDIDWTAPTPVMLAVLQNRTGSLAVVNMIPLVLMAARNNPLIGLLNVSFDSFNLLHRWFAGWQSIQSAIVSDPMVKTGLPAIIAFVLIVIQSVSVVRHAFYETFLHLHLALAVLAIVALWYHLNGINQLAFLIGAIVIWALERAIRLSTLIYRNVGKGGTKATVEALPGDALRVTLKIARPWTFRPGQHLFLYMPSVGAWTCHPFSVAWSEEREEPTSEKGLAMTRQDVLATKKPTMSLLIRRRAGFTATMGRKAERAPDGKITVHAFVEGPYGGLHLFQSYGTVVKIAGGVGITHQISHVHELVAGSANSTVAVRRVVLVWIVPSPEHLEWIRPWMTSILGIHNCRNILRILFFVTQPHTSPEIDYPSATVQMSSGRPDIDVLIGAEADKQVGAMGVSVCGPGSLSDDVRNAIKKRQTKTNIDFIEESFSW